MAVVTVSGWRVCDVTEHPFLAAGDGLVADTNAIRDALAVCDEVHLPYGNTFLTGPQNLTSNQLLRVDGTLLASNVAADYALIDGERHSAELEELATWHTIIHDGTASSMEAKYENRLCRLVLRRGARREDALLGFAYNERYLGTLW